MDKSINKIIFDKNLEIYQQKAKSKKAKTIVFCHGVGSKYEHYLDWKPLLEDYNFYSFTLPGHNKLPVKKSELTIANFANKIIAWIKHAKLKDIILVGHSMGGAIVAKVASELGPKIIKKLILVAPYNLRCANLLTFLYFQGQFNTYLLKIYLQAVKKRQTQNFVKLANSFLNFLEENHTNLRAITHHLIQINTLRESTKFYRSLQNIPTHLITFSRDVLVPGKLTQNYLSKLIPNLKTSQMPKATHIYLIEEPERFIEELNKIVKAE